MAVYKVTWKMIYQDFKRRFPDMGQKALGFVPHGIDRVLIWLPYGTKVIYDHTLQEIVGTIEPDPDTAAYRQRFKRSKKRGSKITDKRNLEIWTKKQNGATLRRLAEEYNVSHIRIHQILRQVEHNKQKGYM